VRLKVAALGAAVKIDRMRVITRGHIRDIRMRWSKSKIESAY
jgi:hypothetical protein